jgi:tRNA (guanosine-2'-O-)-methyltransferase
MIPQPEGSLQMDALLQRATPLPERFHARGVEIPASAVTTLLRPCISDSRAERIDEVIAARTRSVAVVIEGLANAGNVAAVMRSAEGLGFLRFDLIQGSVPYKHSARTAQGAEKWLDVRTWRGPEACALDLKEQGYRILATHLDVDAQPLGKLDFTEPTALVFGNELGGISRAMLDHADGTCAIPMSGFAQSFNISVAAATCLYHARQDRIRRLGRHGDLSPAEKEWLQAAYYLRTVKEGQAILDREL